ncbi:c-type cytochrome [Azohydromonas aeria]|uniref:c-type cytochrome n=1 Tax=Azohydromonas aeria TaxID=2590212 RepID=UPI001E332D1A|nr:c-type cytochrome [Azohydromonas aeria]
MSCIQPGDPAMPPARATARRPGPRPGLRGPALALLLLLLAACDRERNDPRRAAPPLPGSEAHVRTSELLPGGAATGLERPNPYAGDAQAIREGERLYGWFNCSGCHAGGGGGMGPPLMDRQWIYGSRPSSVYASIVSGRPGGMPAFGGLLNEQQVWQLVAYIETMGGMGPGGDERGGEGRHDPPPQPPGDAAPDKGRE